jgi:hypothetical protein
MTDTAVPATWRSPLYEALNAGRYQRQDLIRQIEKLTGSRLAVYFANAEHPGASIGPSDVAPFQDLLMDCEAGCRLDLVLQSPGGDVDAAEKLVYMARERAKHFRVIVVDRAKSAATLIALASDEIMMSTTSELGPIDPQVTVFSAEGRPLTRPAQSFLDGLEQIKQNVLASGGELNPVYFPLLSALDPALLDFCQKAILRARQFAEKWLGKHMLATQPDLAAKIALRLTDVHQYRSHGMVIDPNEAEEIGLRVQRRKPEENDWQLLWKLFLAYDLEAKGRGLAKVFETRRVSIAY